MFIKTIGEITMKEEIQSIKKSLRTLSTTYKQMIKSSKNQVLYMAILMKIDSDIDKIEKYRRFTFLDGNIEDMSKEEIDKLFYKVGEYLGSIKVRELKEKMLKDKST